MVGRYYLWFMLIKRWCGGIVEHKRALAIKNIIWSGLGVFVGVRCL